MNSDDRDYGIGAEAAHQADSIQKQMAAEPAKALKIATIYSYAANEADDEEGGLIKPSDNNQSPSY